MIVDQVSAAQDASAVPAVSAIPADIAVGVGGRKGGMIAVLEVVAEAVEGFHRYREFPHVDQGQGYPFGRFVRCMLMLLLLLPLLQQLM